MSDSTSNSTNNNTTAAMPTEWISRKKQPNTTNQQQQDHPVANHDNNSNIVSRNGVAFQASEFIVQSDIFESHSNYLEYIGANENGETISTDGFLFNVNNNNNNNKANYNVIAPKNSSLKSKKTSNRNYLSDVDLLDDAENLTSASSFKSSFLNSNKYNNSKINDNDTIELDNNSDFISSKNISNKNSNSTGLDKHKLFSAVKSMKSNNTSNNSIQKNNNSSIDVDQYDNTSFDNDNSFAYNTVVSNNSFLNSPTHSNNNANTSSSYNKSSLLSTFKQAALNQSNINTPNKDDSDSGFQWDTYLSQQRHKSARQPHIGSSDYQSPADKFKFLTPQHPTQKMAANSHSKRKQPIPLQLFQDDPFQVNTTTTNCSNSNNRKIIAGNNNSSSIKTALILSPKKTAPTSVLMTEPDDVFSDSDGGIQNDDVIDDSNVIQTHDRYRNTTNINYTNSNHMKSNNNNNNHNNKIINNNIQTYNSYIHVNNIDVNMNSINNDDDDDYIDPTMPVPPMSQSPSKNNKRKEAAPVYYKNEDFIDNDDEDNTPLTPTQGIPLTIPAQSQNSRSLSQMFRLEKRSSSFKKDLIYFNSILKTNSNNNGNSNNSGNNVLSQQASQNITPTQPIVNILNNIVYSQSQQQQQHQIQHYHQSNNKSKELIRSSSQLSFDWQQLPSDEHEEITSSLDFEQDVPHQQYPQQPHSTPVPSVSNGISGVDTIKSDHSPTPPKFEESYTRQKFLGALMDKLDNKIDIEDIDDEPNKIDRWNHNKESEDKVVDGPMNQSDIQELQNQFLKNMSDASQTPLSLNSKWMKLDQDLESQNNTKSTPIKLMKKYERGGITQKLMGLLSKQQHTYELITKRGMASTYIHPNTPALQMMPNHYDQEITVKIVGLPSPLQPHVYVTQCIVVGGDNESLALIPLNSIITVIFSMDMRNQWKLDLNSSVHIDYYQYLPTFKKSKAIICLVGRVKTNQNQQQSNTDNQTSVSNNSASNQLQDLIPKFKVITIDSFDSSSSKSDATTKSIATTTEMIPYSQTDIGQFLLNYDIVDIEHIYQGLASVNIMTMILRYFQDKKNQHIKIFVSNLQGGIAEIQVPIHKYERWASLISNPNSLYSECIFTNLTYIDSQRVWKQSELGSFLLHYISPTLRPSSDSFNYSILQVRDDSNYLLQPYVEDETIYKADSTILSVQELFSSLASDQSSYSYQRVNIQAQVEHVHYDRNNMTIFLTSPLTSNNDDDAVQVHGDGSVLKTSNNDSSNSCILNSIAVQTKREYFKDEEEEGLTISQLQAGQSILLQEVFIKPHIPSTPSQPLLFMDQFSQVYPAETLELADAEMGTSSMSLPQPQEFIKLMENQSSLEMFLYYQSIVNVDGVITDSNKSDFLYRGCLQCQTQVIELHGEHVMGYSKEKGFCSKCRKYVDSELMVELRLVVKVEEWLLNVKIGNSYCIDIFEFPLEHANEKEQQYSNQVNSLVGKNINLNGILVPITSESDNSVQLNLDATSCPNFYQIA